MEFIFMSYWPSKFHTYIQPWLTGVCGITTISTVWEKQRLLQCNLRSNQFNQSHVVDSGVKTNELRSPLKSEEGNMSEQMSAVSGVIYIDNFFFSVKTTTFVTSLHISHLQLQTRFLTEILNCTFEIFDILWLLHLVSSQYFCQIESQQGKVYIT